MRDVWGKLKDGSAFVVVLLVGALIAAAVFFLGVIISFI